MISEQNFDRIGQYLAGKLNPQEKSAFESLLTQDAELRKELEIFSTLQKGIEQYGRNTLRKEIFHPSLPFMIRLDRKWKVAISLAAALLAILVYRAFIPAGNERLFLAYYSATDSIHFSKPRGESEIYQIKVDAFARFKEGNYKDAKDLLENLSEQDDESSLLLGITFIQLGMRDEAETKLKKLAAAQSGLGHQAKWYLAMVYLKKNESGAARKVLEEVVKQKGVFSGKAADLLRRL